MGTRHTQRQGIDAGMDLAGNMADSVRVTTEPAGHRCHLAVAQCREGKAVHPAPTGVGQPPQADEQRLTPLPESYWQRLEAKVPDDQQTLWWLMGMGMNVDVLEPPAWRQMILETATQIISRSEGVNSCKYFTIDSS